MSIYKKLCNIEGPYNYDEKMYRVLSAPMYRSGNYRYVDLGEEMAVIMQVIMGWWKPRFLLDNRAGCAYEFMDSGETSLLVTTEDIDWKSLEGLPEKALQQARSLSFHFPSFIYGYRNGIAVVSWQLNPDGRYYADDDGFGMTNDVEITIFGTIDRSGKVVSPFSYSRE